MPIAVGEVGDGGALIAVAPKHLQRPVESVVKVELTRASDRHGPKSFNFFIDHYISPLTASVQSLNYVSIDT